MSKNLVLQHLSNQLAHKIMSMMNIVNIFNSAYGLSVYSYLKMTIKGTQTLWEVYPHMYQTLFWTLKPETWTWKSMVAEVQLCQSKLCPQSEGTERSQEWQTARWQQCHKQQAEPGILGVDINPWNTFISQHWVSYFEFYTELAE